MTVRSIPVRRLPNMTQVKLALSDILTAFNEEAIGSRVTNISEFSHFASVAIGEFDFASQRVPGQGFIMVPEAVPYVSAGVGRKSSDPSHYVCREHRGVVSAYLKREFAASVEGCALVVYTVAAYLADPDVTPKESARIKEMGATHVLVAVLAFAGPKSPLTPYRFVWNLGGGNNEALTWSADEIREKAKEIISFDNDWSAVAD